MNKHILQQALEIAQTEDVSTPVDSVVLFSISYLPTKQNKLDALEFIKNNPNKMLLDHTKCGKKLIELGMDDIRTPETVEIWSIASKRFIEQAQGNITAFTKNADPRSVFMSVELPLILQNPNISKINDVDKFKF